jgi:O-succinylbenzoate synthase
MPPLAGLLPSGVAALNWLSRFREQGYRSFKWKIGIFPLSAELSLLPQLCQQLPADGRLRLDANGSLSRLEAELWLQHCDLYSQIEYLEQPLAPTAWTDLLELNQHYRTPIALDESVATLGQLQMLQRLGWTGIYVLKPAICGYPHRLRQFCQTHHIDAVFSSVFETGLGRRAALELASDCGNPARAMGFGVQNWLEHDGLDDPDPEQVWQRLFSFS